MKIIFFGTPQFVVPVLETLIKHFTVVGVVTTPDEKVGRKQLITPSPVKIFAQTHTIPVFQPDTLKELNTIAIEQWNNTRPDIFVVAAYGKIIPNEVINLPRLGSINIHPSRLPDYRGPSPLQETILAGDKETAISIMQMDADVDHGPILAVKPLSIDPTDTFLSLAENSFKLGAEMLPETMKQLNNGTIVPQEQDHTKATFTNHITKEDGFFDVNNPPSPEILDRMIRAYYPWPTAWTKIRIKHNELRIKLLPEKKIQVEGKKITNLEDFYNGYPELKETIEKLFGRY